MGKKIKEEKIDEDAENEESNENETEDAESTESKGRGSLFLGILRSQILQPRFDALIEYGEDKVKQMFDEISQRMAWYNTCGLYKAATGTENPDLAGSSNDQYKAFLQAIQGFCEGKKNVKKAVGVNPKLGEYWGLLRKALNIEAKGRAICYGASGDDVLVVPANKSRYLQKGLFAVICEKETLGRKWLAEMERRGWNDMFILIVTQGFSSCEVIETLMEIRESVESGATNFHVGILHDCDIAGMSIRDDVGSFYPVDDFGINFELLDGVAPDLWDQLKEVSKTSAKQKKILINKKQFDILARLDDHRLELDNLYVKKGIDVFCDYAEKIIDANWTVWDLNRLTTPSASNPQEYYDMQNKVEGIWDKIVFAATGKKPWQIDWTACANKKRSEFKDANRNYNANVQQIKQYKTHIQKQSSELQDIVSANADNIEMLKAIQTIVEMLNIEKLEAMIKEKGESENPEDDDDNSDESEDDTDESEDEDDNADDCCYKNCKNKATEICTNCGDSICEDHANTQENGDVLCDDCDTEIHTQDDN